MDFSKDYLPVGPFQRIVVVVVVAVVLALYGFITTSRKYKGISSMDCRERRSHARGVYLAQYTVPRAWEQQG